MSFDTRSTLSILRPIPAWRNACWLVGLLALGSSVAAQEPPQPPRATSEPSPATAAAKQPGTQPDWAASYLQNPLVNIDSPTLADLQQGLADPNTRASVIREHFPRATQLSRAEQQTFLIAALDSEFMEIRQQAAEQLQRLGMLEELVASRLRGLALQGTAAARNTGLMGLAQLPAERIPGDAEYLQLLIQMLTSDDAEVRQAAASQLEQLGTLAVPALLDAISAEQTETLTRRSAEILGRVAHGELATLAEPVMQAMAAPVPRSLTEPPTAKSKFPEVGPATAKGDPPKPREVDEDHPETVRVFYGTNRELTSPETVNRPLAAMHVGIFLLTLGSTLCLFWPSVRGSSQHAADLNKRSSRWSILWLAILWTTTILWSAPSLNRALQLALATEQEFSFGPRRSANGTIYYGSCDVSIPPTHKVGVVEAPLIGPEDEGSHVVLKSKQLLDEEEFFTQVRAALASYQEPEGCFVFIHGFNVNFDNAAKRTAQIYYDLDFQGVPIFYSWPSRASMRHYFSDRNEVLFSRELIKEFLVQVAKRAGASRVHVIAHSMGADAVSQAIASIESGDKIFDQIILAAPDIDAGLFINQILPKLEQRSKRTTLYCSRNDLALHASYHFNDSWRAGDSSRGVLVAPGLDTIDASSIDTELLGHSYYGNCLPILNDVAQLLLKNASPAERDLVVLPLSSDTSAWTFPQFANESPPVGRGDAALELLQESRQ